MLNETKQRGGISAAAKFAPLLSEAGRIWAVRQSDFEALVAGFGAWGAESPNGTDQRSSAGDDRDDDRYQTVGRSAIIHIRGLLTKGGLSLFGFDLGSSYRGIERQVRDAAKSDAVDNIVLHVSSPGGSSFGVGGAADAIFEARSSGKKIIAFVDGIATSAAYVLASQAHRVVLGRRDAMTASIGTYAIIGDWSRYYADQGVVFHRLRAGEKKAIGVHGIAISPDDLADLQREVDLINRFFIDDVARGRGRSQISIRAVADGAMRFAQDAINVGLADEIKPLDVLLTELARESAPKIEVENQRRAKMDADAWRKQYRREEANRREQDRQSRAAACGMYKHVGRSRHKVAMTADELDEAGIAY